MAERRRGLGRGIGALIPESQKEHDRPIDVFFGQKAEGDAVAELVQSVVSRETPREVSRNGAEIAVAAFEKSRQAKRSKKSVTSSKKVEASTAGVDKKGSAATKVHTLAGDKNATVSDRVDRGSVPKGTSDVGAVSRETELVEVPGATYAELPLNQIVPNQRQPRTFFDSVDLQELTESIREVGVLQPVIVRPLDAPIAEQPEARYELIMGERRLRASQRAGMATIPAIVRRTADEDLLRDALLENLHRAQLNALEEAAAYQQLLEDFACTQEELSRRIARSRPQISNTLRLLKLPASVQGSVADGILSAGHARALLGLSDVGEMEKLAARIEEEGLSVRQVEAIVAAGSEPVPHKQIGKAKVKRYAPELGELSTRLAGRFDTKVKVEMGVRKGAIKIDFTSIDDLNRILDLLSPGEDGVHI